MQKENIFVFIALLPIAIQAENHEFSLGQLFELHTEQRNLHKLNKLKKDIEMSSLAAQLASKSITNKYYNIYEDKDIKKKYKVNALRLNYCDFDENSKLSSEMVFNQWLVQEKFFNDNNEVMVYPTKILCKDTQQIGLGYEVTDNEAVVVALYYPNYEDC